MKKFYCFLLFAAILLINNAIYAQVKEIIIDSDTKQNISQSLWMKDYREDSIPKNILEKINSEKNSNISFATRYKELLEHLKKSKLSFVTSRNDRYDEIIKSTNSRSPQQCYAGALLLGPESVIGYTPISYTPDFIFPSIDAPQFDYQIGWHFFVGNFTDEENNHYSVQFMFWQYSLLPPPLAKQLGLSDIENQTVELHLAISNPQTGIHYRANTVVVAGTTGLVTFNQNPFNYSLGNNSIQSLNNSANLFPLQLKARGWDMGKTPNVPIEINLSIANEKGYFLEGDKGCAPSIDGLGTLYYSAANLKLIKDRENVITIDGKRIKLMNGSMWYDHQWANGFMPNGAPEHAVLRAAQNLNPPSPGGWDWFMIQFHNNPVINKDGEVQLAISALHTNDNKKFYWQTEPTPPPDTMTANCTGKYIDAKNNTVDITGKMKVTRWVKSSSSPNPAIYPVTNTWYPAKYTFNIEGDIPGAIKKITVTPIIATGQFGFFSNGLEYNEGGAVVTDSLGNELGRGFAEATNYANCNANVLKLTGLPVNAETITYIEPSKTTWWMKIKSFFYLLFHKKELNEIMKKERGL